MRVDRVGLAHVADREHPHLRGQLRRHVDDSLPVVHKSVRKVFADPVAALDSPDSLGKSLARAQHPAITVVVRAVGARGQHSSLPVDHLNRR